MIRPSLHPGLHSTFHRMPPHRPRVLVQALTTALALAAALAPTLATALIAQDADIPAIADAEYAARRAALAERMGEGVVVAFGAVNAVDYDFALRQLPAFDYLTGFHEPDAVLVMVHEHGQVRPTLFTDRPTVRTQLYEGFRDAPVEVARGLGGEVRQLDEVHAVVDSLVATGLPFYELRDFRSNDAAARDTATRGRLFVDALRRRHPGLEVGDLHPAVDAMRAKKSLAEVALLRRAVAITDEAHRAALQAIEPGAWEYQVQAVIQHTFRGLGGDGPAYTSIVGSGLNSTVLHYVDNNRRMEAGDLILMDIGAAIEGYAADITRTAPVNGTFSPDQRAVYDIVLESVKAAEAAARPGAPAAASLQAATDVRLRGMTELGLIDSPDATYDPPWPVNCDARPDQCLQGMLFMIHGISHGIGLEVHDPAQFYYGDRTFQPGDVFTIEPGIYVNADVLDLLPDTPKNRAFVAAAGETIRRYHAIGVRIEDDYLVTGTGVERLSAAPREADEVEAAMARRGQ